MQGPDKRGSAVPAHRRSTSPDPLRRLLIAALTALMALGLVPVLSAAPAAATPTAPGGATTAVAQDLLWTADNSVTDYRSAPATAVAGPATIIFENSRATGNTIAMSHTLTFDTTTPGYNHDVNVDILANPLDAQGGRWEVEATLTPGTYRYFCAIPGHGSMVGELVVTGSPAEDTTAPTVTTEITGQQDGDGAYIGAATVALDAVDDGSGVASVEYDLDGTGYQTYDEPLVIDTVGAHTLTYRATDVAGNVSEPATATVAVVAAPVDTTPPTVTAEVTGEQDGTGAYLGSATVTLDALDESSGVAVTEYDLDGAGFVPYTEPVVVTAPGSHTLTYRATDGAGNTSVAGSAAFSVVTPPADTTAPTVTAEVTGEQDTDGAYLGAATVTLDAVDDGSGVATVEFDLDGTGYQTYTEPLVIGEVGTHTLTYRATDVAGNVSEASSVTVTVAASEQDTTAPVVLPEVLGEQDSRGAYVGTATVTLTAVDEASGIASVDYNLDGTGYQAYTEPFDVTAVGAHTLTYRATDVAGNMSEPTSITFSVVAAGPADSAAPQVSATVVGTRDAAGRYMGRGTVSLQATDEGSGIASVEYRLDGGTWQRYTAPVVVVAPGRHTFAHRATDRKGNTSTMGSVTFAVAAMGRDMCPSSDARPTVVIGNHDSTVVNVDTGNGCTINDLINEDGTYNNHRQFLRHVRSTTAELLNTQTISRGERNRIIDAATMSDVGR